MIVVGRKTRTYTLQVDVMTLGKRKTIKRKIGNALEFDAIAARQEAMRLTSEIRQEMGKYLNRGKSLTLGQAWEDYARRLEARISTGERSAKTAKNYRDCMERLLADWLSVPLREIGEQPALISEKHKLLTAQAGPYQANRAMSTLRIVYNHALKKRLDPGLSPHNPVGSVDFKTFYKNTSLESFILLQYMTLLIPAPFHTKSHHR